MNMEILLDELEFLIEHVFSRPEEGVKRWTSVECEDYQIPINRILEFLTIAGKAVSQNRMPLKDCPESSAIIDIIRNSHLNEILELDFKEGVSYRVEIPTSAKNEIAQFIDSRSTVIKNWG